MLFFFLFEFSSENSFVYRMKGLNVSRFYLPLPSLVYHSGAHATSKTPNTRAPLPAT